MSADCLRPSGFAVAILAVGLASEARAGVSTDGTAGPRVHLPGPEFAIGADLGTQVGHNLFHSFDKFSLANGERATFSGPNDVRNLISRVTGGARSDIDGTIKSTIPGADFYFINPAGVMFGPNARLDLQGSFHVSTADELRFADGAKFSATNPTSSFTVAAPEAFGFLGAQPSSLVLDRSQLEVPKGEALSIVGGETTIKGTIGEGIFSGPTSVHAEAGTITLTAIGGPGALAIDSGEITGESLGTVRLTDQARLDVSGDRSGMIRILSGRLIVEGDSAIAANTGASDGAEEAVTITANDLAITGFSRITSDASGTGRAGGITLTAGRLLMQGSFDVHSETQGAGAGGTVTIHAGSAEITGRLSRDPDDVGFPTISTLASGTGAGGSIIIAADQLVISDSASISSATFGTGRGGAVDIRARDLEIRDGFVDADTFGPGDAGTVALTATNLAIGGPHVGSITSDSLGPEGGEGGGQGGAVIINAENLSILDGGYISSGTGTGADGGAVIIWAHDIEIRDAFIDNTTSGIGDGGSVTITAENFLILDAAYVSSEALFGTGSGGAVTIGAKDLMMRNSFISSDVNIDARPESHAGMVTVRADDQMLLIDSYITSGTVGPGDAGRVVVRADDLVMFDSVIDSGSSLSGEEGNQGDAGTVTVHANNLTLRDSSVIASESEGSGAAGSVVILGASKVVLEENARISTTTGSSGGGDIRIEASDLLLLRDGSRIGVDVASGGAGAGNITIDPTFLILDKSAIGANADAGSGGRIEITADQLILSPGSTITARAGPAGIDGTVVISAPEVDLSGGLVVVEGTFLDKAPLRVRCGARRDIGASSFTGVGRGGLPPSPDGPLASGYASGLALGALDEQSRAIARLAVAATGPCHGVL